MVADELITLAEVEDAARRLGCNLRTRGVGPAYRVEIDWTEGPDTDGEPGELGGTNLLGYSDGFTQPTGVAHLESINVRRYSGYESLSRKGRLRHMRSPAGQLEQGIGVLISTAVGCWIRECDPFRCKRAQLLAIRDEPRQHAVLVRYYRKLGFVPLREVRSRLSDAVDMVTWGGEGTLMELQIEDFLLKWGGTVRQMCLSGDSADSSD